MKIPKFSINIPFLRKDKKETVKPIEEKKQALPPGVVLIGRHSTYKSTAELLETFPIYTWNVAKCLFEIAYGKDLYISEGIDIDLAPLHFISVKGCEGKIQRIDENTPLQGKELEVNETEQRGGERVLKKWIERVMEFPLTCEAEMWKHANADQKKFIALKLFKDYGEDLLFKAWRKWNPKYPELTLCGMWRVIAGRIFETIERKGEKELKEFLSLHRR